TDALRQFVVLLGVDRGQLLNLPTDTRSAFVTHSWAVEGVPVVPPRPVADMYPWGMGRLRAGLPVVTPSTANLPDDAKTDRSSFLRAGVKSTLSAPMIVRGRVEGAIAFGCLRQQRDWPDDLVDQVRVLAEVFGNALAHKQAQEALDEAIRFEHLLSDTLA